MLDLSIIIVNWNAKDFLRECLNSIYVTVKGVSYEVIVVDNASSDNSIEMIEAEYPAVRLIKNDINAGFGNANNMGARISRGKYLLFLNPDTNIQGDSLKVVIDFMNENAYVAASQPMILNRDGSLQCLGRKKLRVVDWMLKLFGLFDYTKEINNRDPNQPAEVEVISGACFIVRKEVLESVGGFDENLFLYVEEEDLCRRIRDKRWKIYYVPHTTVFHYLGQSTKQNIKKAELEGIRSMLHFFKKYYPKKVVMLFVILVRIKCGIKIAVNILNYLLPNKKQRATIKREIQLQWQLAKMG